MAIQRRVNELGQMRVDASDLRAIESAASADFDASFQAFVTGADNPYVINGFTINWATPPFGNPAKNLQVIVASGALMHTSASQSGTIYLVPSGTPNVTLNAAVTTNVSGSFVPGTNNYVGIDYYRFQDPGTDTQRYLWDPSTNSEDQTVAPAAIILNYEFVITSTPWASNILPIAVVLTDTGNNVVSVTDSRPLLFRLGTGGATPNPFNVYPWPEGTTENPVTATSTSTTNPFYGGDKAITDLKDWINAVETELLYLGGGPYWYSAISPGPTGSIVQLREDVASTILSGTGTITHSATTAGLMNWTSPINLEVIGSNLSYQIATNPSGTSVTLADQQAAYLSLTRDAVVTPTGTPNVVLNLIWTQGSPTVSSVGGISWTGYPGTTGLLAGDWIKISSLSHAGYYQIATVNSTSQVTLNLIYTFAASSANATQGATYTNNGFTFTVIDTIAGGTVLLCSGTFNPTASGTLTKTGGTGDSTITFSSFATNQTNNTGSAGAPSQYAYGTYNLPGVGTSARQIQISARGSVPISPSTFWLFARSDDSGSIPRVYVRWLDTDLQQGDSDEISGPQIQNVLNYIGSPIESATLPQYVSSYNIYEGGSSSVIPEITSITTSAASAMSPGQYFEINSSGNFRMCAVWVYKDSSGTQPNVPNVNTYIQWPISTGQTNIQTASALATALTNILPFKDFTATSSSNTVTVTNNSSGVCSPAVNGTVGGLVITTTQAGTGPGNFGINDGDNLTLAVKKLDEVVANIETSLDSPNYDEVTEIVSSGSTLTYVFAVTSANATTGATYTNNLATFTVVNTISAGTALVCTSTGTPTSSGTLTKASGVGDATITFSSYISDTLVGPISSGTDITIPANSRNGYTPQFYTVGKGTLLVWLNGQFLDVESGAYTEVGTAGAASNQIQPTFNLVVGDELEFRVNAAAAASGGQIGPAGPVGPTGATGPQGEIGFNSATGPVAVSVKTSNYPVLVGDCFLAGDATSGSFTFTLPAASGNTGRIFYFKRLDATGNTVTVMGAGSDTIDGITTFVLTSQYQSVSVISNGSSGWWVF